MPHWHTSSIESAPQHIERARRFSGALRATPPHHHSCPAAKREGDLEHKLGSHEWAPSDRKGDHYALERFDAAKIRRALQNAEPR